MNNPMVCLECGWKGPDSEAHWHDMSNFVSDSFCDNQVGSGMWECPKCKGLCILDKSKNLPVHSKVMVS